MKTRIVLKMRIPLIISLVLLIAGCISPVSITKLDHSSQSFRDTEGPKSLVTNPVLPRIAGISTPAPEATKTGQPLLPNPTIVAALTSGEQEIFLKELVENKNGCSLPCWWGITPGKTSWQDAKQFLNAVNAKVYSNSFTDDEGAYIVHGIVFEGEWREDDDFGFIEREGQIDAIFVDGSRYRHPEHFKLLWSYYSPKEILNKYGIPSRVLLRAPGLTGIGYGGRTGYILWLIYDDLGYKIRYDGDVDDLPIYHFCPTLEVSGSRIDYISIWMQSPDHPRPLEKEDSILDSEEINDGSVKTIEEASMMSLSEFYELFTQTGEQACFDSPHDIWPKK